MPHHECFIIMGMGGLFVLLGLAAIGWGRREEKGYYNSVSTRRDVREYLEHWPKRPEHGALQTGGWIAITVGLLMIAMGGVFLLWGGAHE